MIRVLPVVPVAFALSCLPARADDQNGWYVFNIQTQQCEGPGGSPADVIRGYRDTFQYEVHAQDETDSSGRVVATVLTVPAPGGGVGEMRLFRGLDRCQQWVKARSSALNRYN